MKETTLLAKTNASRFTKVFLSLCFIVLSTAFLAACDNNASHPDDNKSNKNIGITNFYASPSKVDVGGSATLIWNLKDDKDEIDHVSIEPGFSSIKGLAGQQKVTPGKNTTYTLKMHMKDGTIGLQSQTRVLVFDPEAGEYIPEDADPNLGVLVETVCDDGIDEDNDSEIDCADSDCSADPVCLPPEHKFVDCTVAPSQPANVLNGEPISVSWEGCPFERVWASVDGGPITEYAPEAASTFLYEDTELEDNDPETSKTIEITLIGRLDSADADVVTYTVTIGNPEIPVFTLECQAGLNEACIEYSIDPADGKLIKGQIYTINWLVDGTDNVSLVSVRADESGEPLVDENGEIVEEEIGGNQSGGDLEFIAGEWVSHTLKVTDFQELTQSYLIPEGGIVFTGFESQGTVFEKPITKTFAGNADGEYYFLTHKDMETAEGMAMESVIYHTTDFLTTAPNTIHTGQFELIEGFAVNGDGVIFLGHTNGLYEQTAEGFVQRLMSFGLETVQTILVREAGPRKVALGSDGYLYTAWPVDGIQYFDNDDLYPNTERNYHHMFKNPSDGHHKIVLTSEGVYESHDDGASWEQTDSLASEFLYGYWDATGGYIWNGDDLHEWDGAGFAEIELNMSGIQYAVRKDGRLFVATNSGVKYKSDAGDVVQTNLTESTQVLLLNGNVIIAVTASGEKYELDLSDLD